MKLNIQLFASSKSTSVTENNVVVENNTSNVVVSIYFSANNTSTYFTNKPLYCTCNGVTQSQNVTHSQGGSVSASFTFANIAHEDDGSKSVAWSWTITTGTNGLGTQSDSGTKVLTTIPRTSILGSISDFVLSTSTIIPISITKYSSSFSDTLVVKVDSTTIKTISSIIDGYNLSFTTTELNTIKSLFSGSSTNIEFLLSTYNGSTLIGSSSQIASATDTSRIIGMGRYKSNTGYKYCVNDALDKTLDDGLQVGGALYLNGNKIYTPNIITAFLTSNFSRASAQWSTFPLTLTEKVKVGTKLSISGGKVLIGDGVSKVKVSANISMNSNDNASALMIKKYIGSTLLSDLVYETNYHYGIYRNISASPVVVDVSEGESIALEVYTNDANRNVYILSNATRAETYMTVEVVE